MLALGGDEALDELTAVDGAPPSGFS